MSVLYGHVRAIFLAGLAIHEIWRGRLDDAVPLVLDAYQAGLATRDMPIVASVGIAAAALAAARGEYVEATQVLGAAAALRGSGDESDIEIKRLTQSLRSSLGMRFDPTYATGRAMTREAALARLDPARRVADLLASG
jgi:hypothetical protein